MATLTLNFSNLPEGKQVFIPGLKGEFKNGGSYEVDSLQEDLALPSPVGEESVADSVETTETTETVETSDTEGE